MFSKKLHKNGVWDSLLSSALIAPLGNLLQFCLTVVVARSLTIDEFGYFSFALQIASLMAIILGCGFPIYAQKIIPAMRVNGEDELIETYITWIGVWLLFCSLIVFVCSSAWYYFARDPGIVGIALTIIPSMLWISQLYICLGFNRIPLALAPRDVVLPLVLMGFLQFYSPGSGLALLVVYNLILLVTVGSSIVKLLKSVNFKPNVSLLGVDRIYNWVKNSAPIAVSSLSQYGLNFLDILVLGIVGTMANVGAYTACMRVAMVVSILNRVTTIAVAHKLSEMHASDDLDMVWKTYKQAIMMSAVSGLFIVVFVLIFGEKILSVFGSNYSNHYLILVVLCLGNFVACLAGPVVIGHNMIGNQNYVAKSQLLWIMVALLLYFIIIPRYSLIGAATVTAVTQSLMRMRQFYVLFTKLSNGQTHKVAGNY